MSVCDYVCVYMSVCACVCALVRVCACVSVYRSNCEKKDWNSVSLRQRFILKNICVVRVRGDGGSEGRREGGRGGGDGHFLDATVHSFFSLSKSRILSSNNVVSDRLSPFCSFRYILRFESLLEHLH